MELMLVRKEFAVVADAVPHGVLMLFRDLLFQSLVTQWIFAKHLLENSAFRHPSQKKQ